MFFVLVVGVTCRGCETHYYKAVSVTVMLKLPLECVIQRRCQLITYSVDGRWMNECGAMLE